MKGPLGLGPAIRQVDIRVVAELGHLSETGDIQRHAIPRIHDAGQFAGKFRGGGEDREPVVAAEDAPPLLRQRALDVDRVTAIGQRDGRPETIAAPQYISEDDSFNAPLAVVLPLLNANIAGMAAPSPIPRPIWHAKCPKT